MLASMVREFRINPFQVLIETISARETPESSWNGDKCELKGFKDTRTGEWHHKIHMASWAAARSGPQRGYKHAANPPFTALNTHP